MDTKSDQDESKLEEKLLKEKDVQKGKQPDKTMDTFLQDTEQKLSDLDQQKTAEGRNKHKSLMRMLKIVEQMKKQNEDMLVKQIHLEQNCKEVQTEIDELKKKETETILAIKQKSLVRCKVLQMKMEAMTDRDEKMRVKLWTALSFGHGDKTAAKNLKELFESKHTKLKALKLDVCQDLKEYDELVEKATALGPSVKQRLRRTDIMKCIRDTSGEKKLQDFMEQIKTLCISEDDGVQQDRQKL